MADARGHDLAYGQFGHATYDPDEQTWNFQRSERFTTQWHPLGEPKTIQAPLARALAASESEAQEIPSARQPRQIRSLVRRFPGIQAAAGLLPPLIRTSEALSALEYHPLRGNLYATGSVPSDTYRHSVPVAAFPTGPTGSDVRFIRIQNQRRGWNDSRASFLEVPTIHGEEHIWKGHRSPIQQIVFAEPLEGASGGLVAVRCLNRTVTLRARLTSEGLTVDNGFTLPVGMTGGSSHADVAFNPYFVRQVAIVDLTGAWSVWELEGRRGEKGKCLARGSVLRDDADSRRGMEDGWARVLWCADPSIVAVASRRALIMAAVSEDSGSTAPTTILSLQEQASWILSVLAAPKRPDCLCVLTSTHVLVLKVGAEQLIGVPVETVASMPHFRNPADLTLSMAAHMIGEHIFMTLLSNADAAVVTIFEMCFDHPDQVRVSLPWNLDPIPGVSIHKDRIIGLGINEIEYKIRRTELERDRTAYRYKEAGMRFFSAVTLDSGLALQQTLRYSRPRRSDLSTAVMALDWEGRVGVTAPKVKKESFIVDDNEVEESEVEEAPLSWFTQRRQHRIRNQNDPQWTISLERLGKEIASQHPWTRDLDETIGELAESLQAQTLAGAVPLRTLLELSEQPVSVADVESAQARLEELALSHTRIRLGTQDHIDAETSEMDLVVRNISTTPPATLSETYNRMVADWITPLPPSIPGRIRLAKEQLIRQTAAMLTLSSRVIRPEPAEQPPDTQAGTQTQPSRQSFGLPMRDIPSSSSLPTLSSSELPLLPTPSPTATPSISTLSSAITNPPIDRLRAYTSFTTPHTIAPLPRNLSTVLSHWTLGADPYAYDWRTASQQVAESQTRIDQQRADLTEKERARMERKRERDERRRRREVEGSRKVVGVGREAVVVVSASQGAPSRGRVEGEEGPSQSQGQGQGQSRDRRQGMGMGTASQVVGGRFGGRPPARKKRKQGF